MRVVGGRYPLAVRRQRLGSGSVDEDREWRVVTACKAVQRDAGALARLMSVRYLASLKNGPTLRGSSSFDPRELDRLYLQ